MENEHLENAERVLQEYKTWIKSCLISDASQAEREQVIETIEGWIASGNIKKAIQYIERIAIKTEDLNYEDPNSYKIKTLLKKSGKPLLEKNGFPNNGTENCIILEPPNLKNPRLSFFKKIMRIDNDNTYLMNIHQELIHSIWKIHDPKNLENNNYFLTMQETIQNNLNKKTIRALNDFNRDTELHPQHLFKTAGKNYDEIKERIRKFITLALLKKNDPEPTIDDLYQSLSCIESQKEPLTPKQYQYKNLIKQKSKIIDAGIDFMLANGGQVINNGPNTLMQMSYYLETSLKGKNPSNIEELLPDLNQIYGDQKWIIDEHGKIICYLTLHAYAASQWNQEGIELDDYTYSLILDKNNELQKIQIEGTSKVEEKRQYCDLLTSYTQYELILDDSNPTLPLIFHSEENHTDRLIHRDDFFQKNSLQKTLSSLGTKIGFKTR